MTRIFKKERPDVVIHAAGQPGVRFSLENPIEDAAINATGTVNVLEVFHQANPKGIFLYTSTNKVYGDRVNTVPIVAKKTRYAFRALRGIHEDFNVDLTGHTPYGVSKLAGDLYTQDYTYSHGLRTGVFRLSCVYGTRHFGFEDQGWLAWFAIRFAQKKPITIYGDGRQVRDVLWADDLARAFDCFIRRPLPGQVFNLGGGRENTLSLLELIDICEKIFGYSVKIRFAEWRKFDQKIYVSDITKAKRLLKWAPTVSCVEGVRRLADWIRENPKLFYR